MAPPCQPEAVMQCWRWPRGSTINGCADAHATTPMLGVHEGGCVTGTIRELSLDPEGEMTCSAAAAFEDFLGRYAVDGGAAGALFVGFFGAQPWTGMAALSSIYASGGERVARQTLRVWSGAWAFSSGCGHLMFPTRDGLRWGSEVRRSARAWMGGRGSGDDRRAEDQGEQFAGGHSTNLSSKRAGSACPLDRGRKASCVMMCLLATAIRIQLHAALGCVGICSGGNVRLRLANARGGGISPAGRAFAYLPR
jgi:hypothetical protein